MHACYFIIYESYYIKNVRYITSHIYKMLKHILIILLFFIYSTSHFHHPSPDMAIHLTLASVALPTSKVLREASNVYGKMELGKYLIMYLV